MIGGEGVDRVLVHLGIHSVLPGDPRLWCRPARENGGPSGTPAHSSRLGTLDQGPLRTPPVRVDSAPHRGSNQIDRRPTRESTNVDVLSNVLQAVRLTGAVYFDIDASSPWVGESPGTQEIAAAIMPGAEHVISFHAVISGSCWATLSDGSAPPLQVEGGDVIVFPHGAPNVLSSSRGERGVPNMAMYY
ncbi:MAG: AraC family transcriptional regulator, partial [Hyphomicrobiales bacterium]